MSLPRQVILRRIILETLVWLLISAASIALLGFILSMVIDIHLRDLHIGGIVATFLWIIFWTYTEYYYGGQYLISLDQVNSLSTIFKEEGFQLRASQNGEEVYFKKRSFFRHHVAHVSQGTKFITVKINGGYEREMDRLIGKEMLYGAKSGLH